MRMVQVIGVIVVAMSLGGCAGVRQQQALDRLQSQVGLLDERVSQLERMTQPGPSVSAFPSSIGIPGIGTEAAGASAASDRTASPDTTARAPSSAKPSTREIQQALKNAGFYQGEVDGKMGPLTRAGIEEFQRLHGLKDDGVVGRQTWAKLRVYLEGAGSEGTETALK